ncbi:two-component regulator propeller domain-containing protein [Rhodothermus marinus]|uniref:two-component regulator propeller domain-containing protein n=1 Tax=Rhodothermus marinus TaxID=29549 RepID=UPI000B00518D|nr:two-component regulator propeller domain-containing protein [Rhodothermus marinus]
MPVAPFTEQPVYRLLEDLEGRLWVSTADALVVLADGRRVARYTEKDGLKGLPARDLVVDSLGVVWVATLEGLGRIDATGIRWLTEANGLPTSVLNALMVDREGMLWLGTLKGWRSFADGLSRTTPCATDWPTTWCGRSYATDRAISGWAPDAA